MSRHGRNHVVVTSDGTAIKLYLDPGTPEIITTNKSLDFGGTIDVARARNGYTKSGGIAYFAKYI